MAIYCRHLPLLLAAVFTVPFPSRAITTTGQYTVTILGRVQHNYSGSPFIATCVNDNGVVAGFAIVKVPDNPQQTDRGVLWRSTIPHYTILATISEDYGGFDSEATWINNSGIAVGGSQENTSQGLVFVPVMFTPSGIVDLGRKNAARGEATCINNNSQVVGNLFYNTPSQTTQAFLYQNGFMTLLGYPVPTAGLSIANAINNNGLIVGQGRFAGDVFHAAFYTNGAWVDLGTLGSDPSFSASATSVNDSGTIVGSWHTQSQQGCFIHQNGQMSDLNAPNHPGTLTPFINNSGQVVAGNFIYQNGVWKDINDLDLGDGWVFSEAIGINNKGAIIGTMFRVIGGLNLYRSALLTPVSPGPQRAPAQP